MACFQHYRYSTVGLALQEVLAGMIDAGAVGGDTPARLLLLFDEVRLARVDSWRGGMRGAAGSAAAREGGAADGSWWPAAAAPVRGIECRRGWRQRSTIGIPWRRVGAAAVVGAGAVRSSPSPPPLLLAPLPLLGLLPPLPPLPPLASRQTAAVAGEGSAG